MNSPADVPVVIVVLHLAALAVLVVRAAVVYFRRLSLLYKDRTNEPDASWLRLLQVSLGLFK